MGQLVGSGGGLTTPNSALMSPQGQPTFMGSPSQVMSRANQQIPSPTAMLGSDVMNPQDTGAGQNLPKIGTPSFAQAVSTGPAGMPNALSPGLSKGGKLLAFLSAGLQGALAGRAAQEQTIAQTGGRRAGGIGTGFQAGYSLPFLRASQEQQVERGGLENQMLANQVQYAPLLQRLGIMKTSADIGRTTAEAGKATAEAGAIPTKTGLEQAQTEAAFYKDDPNLGLIDLRTKQPVTTGGMAPLSAEEAAILGKQPGDTVPLKLKNTANEMVNRGIRTVQAGGRSLLVDNKGNTIKDMGQATPMAVINATNPFGGMNFPIGTGDEALKGMTPQQQTLVKKIANYDIDPTQFRTNRNPKSYADLLSAVSAYDPNYDQTQYGTKSALRKSFTSGSDAQNVQALNTVAHHLNLLDQANDALGNGNLQLLNQIGNAYNVKVAGQSAPVVFNAIKNAVSGELGSVFKKSGATDPEIASIGSTISDSLGKGITKDVIGADVGLVQGRLKALQFKYENGMGKPADFKIISPEAEQAFNRLGGQGGPPPGASHAVVINGQTVGYTSDGRTMTPVQAGR
ncbi:MAG TPA: hypothetical protein VJ999_11425 [Candidatus Sulfotelmatobacter sp.]|nr:hypothetical protein [Candidatus Sulfotelmatobacter sp.]